MIGIGPPAPALVLVPTREQCGSVELVLALPLLLSCGPNELPNVGESTSGEQYKSLLPPGFRSGVTPAIPLPPFPVEVNVEDVAFI